MDEIARPGGIQRLLDEVGAGPSRTERDVEAARARIKRGLLFLPPILMIALLVGVFFGEWVIAAPMLVLGGWAGARLIRELKEPDRFLQLSPYEVTDRILERPHLLHRGSGDGETAGRLMDLQDLLDRLELPGSWEHRARRSIARWGSWLGAAGWGVFAGVSALTGGNPGPVIVGLAAGATFAYAGMAERRREAKRKRAIALLEQAMENAIQVNHLDNGYGEA